MPEKHVFRFKGQFLLQIQLTQLFSSYFLTTTISNRSRTSSATYLLLFILRHVILDAVRTADLFRRLALNHVDHRLADHIIESAHIQVAGCLKQAMLQVICNKSNVP